jgi:23S rRNA pseudouridine2605 synthase
LDLNTEGLIILTDDGLLGHQLAHPRFKIEKTYLVRVRGKVRQEALEKIRKGVLLEDGPTAPARAENLRYSRGHSWLEITIHEGRNRQVRRMLEALGHSVSRLKRIRYAFLDGGNLKPGQYRFLTKGEIARLKKL